MTVVHIERVRSLFDSIGADMPPPAAIQDESIERALWLLKSRTYDAEGATIHCRFDVDRKGDHLDNTLYISSTEAT
jgi:hypothetical protein